MLGFVVVAVAANMIQVGFNFNAPMFLACWMGGVAINQATLGARRITRKENNQKRKDVFTAHLFGP